MISVKKRSQKQEKELAKKVDGKPVAGSGCCWYNKADVRNEQLLIEAKFTDKHYYTLTYATWNKIRNEAIKDSLRSPAMIIDVQDLRLVVFEQGFTGLDEHSISHKSSLRLQRTMSYPYYFRLNGEFLCAMTYLDAQEYLDGLSQEG